MAYNIIQLDPVYALRAIVFTLIFTAVMMGVAVIATRSIHKGALLATLALLLFLTYGHVYNLIENRFSLGHHRYLMALWFALFLIGAGFIFRSKKKLRVFSTFLNLFSVFLIAMPLFQIARFELQHKQPAAVLNPRVDSVWQQEGNAVANSPDVYYIVLDAYSRSDMLKEYYSSDNSQFIQELRQLGFYVADCSMSNYSYTASSISSTLNMDFLDQFASKIIDQNRSYYDLGEMIKHNKVRELFHSLGYRFVTFDTGIWWLDITDSDQFISKYKSPWETVLNFNLLGNFEKYYIQTTALRALDEYKMSQENKFGKVWLSTEKAHYNQILFDLDQLTELPKSGSPQFIYAHLVAPHFPYVFNPDGSFAYTLSDHPGYRNEIEYLDKRLIEVLKKIITDSKTPPIIILQGDHGLKNEVRNANLSAYYFPNGGEERLYPTLTSVNTFRLVFNTYFGADYPLLPDVARSASYQKPYDFTIVEDDCPVQ
ncbi:MAG: sulfatase-like hydrolase/transferase [Chloroflexi bacterium]|nr:sulfatase-like hydrolase/transferase [Chloroflexota bacterium]